MLKSKGFTIVELLIVIVVIAILAAITIVAYNGIQNRAKQSAAQSRLTQANKKILAYAVQNSDTYPSSLAQAEVDNSDNALQYTVDNNASPKTYGLTATSGTFSYYVSSTSSTPVAGGYQGHGQGGIAAITNFVTNPSVETGASWYGGVFGTGGAGTSSRLAATPQHGSAMYRITWTTAPTSTSGLWVNGTAPVVPGAGGKTYTASVYVRPSWSGSSFFLNLVGYTANGATVTGETYGAIAALPLNTWTRLSATWNVPSNTEMFLLRARQNSGTGPVVNSTLDIDGVMLTEGPTLYNYADGSSPNWAWNGVANNATSTGPPLL